MENYMQTRQVEEAFKDSPLIKLMTEDNPKRPKTKAHKKFNLLMRFNGKPIKAFKAEEGKHPSLDEERNWPATELRWARKLKLLKLVKSH
jgi:hypothetical protein